MTRACVNLGRHDTCTVDIFAADVAVPQALDPKPLDPQARTPCPEPRGQISETLVARATVVLAVAAKHNRKANPIP
jgi:hypothetical protein